MVHALLEVDVTRARRLLRDHKAAAGEALSFTAFVVACLGCAIGADRRVHAYRDWRNRLVLFDEVDVAILVEPNPGAVAIPHVVRATNRRTVREIHEEIRAVQEKPARSEQRSGWLMRLSALVPAFVRRVFLRLLCRSPHLLKRSAGTAIVTAIGMFGAGGGWALPIVPIHTLGLVLGGICERPMVVDGALEIREMLSLTLSFDHDIVDGAPAARFARALCQLIEGGHGLDEAIASVQRGP